jgi:hypothetical protein
MIAISLYGMIVMIISHSIYIQAMRVLELLMMMSSLLEDLLIVNRIMPLMNNRSGRFILISKYLCVIALELDLRLELRCMMKMSGLTAATIR